MSSLIGKEDLEIGAKKSMELEKPIGNLLDLPKISLSEILLKCYRCGNLGHIAPNCMLQNLKSLGLANDVHDKVYGLLYSSGSESDYNVESESENDIELPNLSDSDTAKACSDCQDVLEVKFPLYRSMEKIHVNNGFMNMDLGFHSTKSRGLDNQVSRLKKSNTSVIPAVEVEAFVPPLLVMLAYKVLSLPVSFTFGASPHFITSQLNHQRLEYNVFCNNMVLYQLLHRSSMSVHAVDHSLSSGMPLFSKSTYQPSNMKRKRTHGFIARRFHFVNNSMCQWYQYSTTIQLLLVNNSVSMVSIFHNNPATSPIDVLEVKFPLYRSMEKIHVNNGFMNMDLGFHSTKSRGLDNQVSRLKKSNTSVIPAVEVEAFVPPLLVMLAYKVLSLPVSFTFGASPHFITSQLNHQRLEYNVFCNNMVLYQLLHRSSMSVHAVDHSLSSGMPLFSKSTYQPSNMKRKRTHGFIARRFHFVNNSMCQWYQYSTTIQLLLVNNSVSMVSIFHNNPATSPIGVDDVDIDPITPYIPHVLVLLMWYLIWTYGAVTCMKSIGLRVGSPKIGACPSQWDLGRDKSGIRAGYPRESSANPYRCRVLLMDVLCTTSLIKMSVTRRSKGKSRQVDVAVGEGTSKSPPRHADQSEAQDVFA
ncbi:hypothetical protein BC332_30377 [Capsicum chinense]|nr:hypothetical protein BC332_30377 [Capsicum chinense]